MKTRSTMHVFRALFSVCAALAFGPWPARAATDLELTAPTNRLVIKGSNTFGEELGPRLIEGYTDIHDDVAIELEKKGSASGIMALLDGTCDIASTSRMINEDELRMARSRGIHLRNSSIGYYSVALIVHPDNQVRDLTSHQVRDIFTGVTTNWKDVGGRDAPIEVLIRDASGGTHLGFQELAMEKRPYAPAARGYSSYRDILDEVRRNERAIGYCGMDMTRQEGIQVLNINGESPDHSAVAGGLYPYARLLRLYTNKDKENKLTRSFIRYVRSRQGQSIVQSVGFTPVKLPPEGAVDLAP